MQFRQIEMFSEIVKAGSFSLAASRMGLSQPALSRQISLLEREFGQTLFIRQGGRIQLTPAGDIMSGYAHRFEDLRMEMHQALSDATGQNLKGRYRISTGGTIAAWVLPAIIARLQREYAGLQLQIIEGDAVAISETLRNGEVDLAITSEKANDPRMIQRLFCTDQILPVVAKNHPLGRRRQIQLAELNDWPFILYHPGSAIQRQIQKKFRQHSRIFKPRPFMELQNLGSALRMVEAGLGIGFTSQSSLHPGITVLPVAELMVDRSYFFVYRKHHQPGLPLLIERMIAHYSA
ncbi:MAG: LysR family transcriptional regulator [Leptospiraceae bacterium]|nr:LysR family transcriptional regulator [Leptospiraceae bacterium]